MSKKPIVTTKSHKEEAELEKAIRKLEREIKRLKSENKVLQDALATTEEYLIAQVADKTLEDVFQDVQNKMDVKLTDLCPNCQSHNLKKINLGSFKIIACSNCTYRNRVNESRS